MIYRHITIADGDGLQLPLHKFLIVLQLLEEKV